MSLGYANICDSSVCVGKAIATDLPDIEYTPYKETDKKKRRPHISEIKVYSFPQEWASTALGFGGIGGQAFTESQTTVVMLKDSYYASVYFGSEFAYTVKINSKFYSDLSKFMIADCERASTDYEIIKQSKLYYIINNSKNIFVDDNQ